MECVCPVCSCTRFRIVNNEMAVVQCQECQLFYWSSYPSPEEMKKFYVERYGYVKTRNGNPVFDEKTFKENLDRSNRKGFNHLMKTYPTGLNVLEIGADAGGAARCAKSLGNTVEAVEMCSDYADRMEADGIKVYRDMFENVKFSKNKRYNIVVAFEVLEHFIRPLECVKRICELLVPGGSFIFSTPVAPVGLTSHSTYGIQQAHYTVFNPVSLNKLFTLCRFSQIPDFTKKEKMWTVKK